MPSACNRPTNLPNSSSPRSCANKRAAISRLPKAQAELSERYAKGTGVPLDDEGMRRWRPKAAEGEDADSQLIVGLWHHTGEGYAKDEHESVRWLKRAAAQKDVSALVMLGMLYSEGKDNPKDPVQAAGYFRQAADLGDLKAQYAIACLLEAGDGLTKDLTKARSYLESTAYQGHAMAEHRYGVYLKSGTGGEKDIDGTVTWLERSAARKHPEAMLLLGQMYASGDGVPQDSKKAFAWVEKAAAQGSVIGTYLTGLHYLDGTGVEKDSLRGDMRLLAAASEEYAPAQSAYAESLLSRPKAPASTQVEALDRLQRAAAQGDSLSCLRLGIRHQAGDGVKKDAGRSMHYLRQAAVERLWPAFTFMAILHMEGRGVPKDPVEAYAYAILGARSGNAEAIDLRDVYSKGLSVTQRKTGATRAEALLQETHDFAPAQSASALPPPAASLTKSEALAETAETQPRATLRDLLGHGGEVSSGNITGSVTALFGRGGVTSTSLAFGSPEQPGLTIGGAVNLTGAALSDNTLVVMGVNVRQGFNFTGGNAVDVLTISESQFGSGASFNLFAGDDLFTLDSSTFRGAFILLGGAGADTAGIGNFTGNMSPVKFLSSVTIRLEGGDDQLFVAIGSPVAFQQRATLDGGAGADTLTLGPIAPPPARSSFPAHHPSSALKPCSRARREGGWPSRRKTYC